MPKLTRKPRSRSHAPLRSLSLRRVFNRRALPRQTKQLPRRGRHAADSRCDNYRLAVPQPEQPPIQPTDQPKKVAAFSASNAEMVPYMPVYGRSLGAASSRLSSGPTALAQRGSLYAAQTEFIQVLRRIARQRMPTKATTIIRERSPPVCARSTKPTTSLPPACNSNPR